MDNATKKAMGKLWKSREQSCARCGEPFIPKVYNQIYCSPRCRQDAKNKQDRRRVGKRERFCRYCGDPIPDTEDVRSAYCSTRCRLDAKRGIQHRWQQRQNGNEEMEIMADQVQITDPVPCGYCPAEAWEFGLAVGIQ